MTHVIDTLWIGNSRDGLKALKENSFDAVINLMRNKSPEANFGPLYFKIALPDRHKNQDITRLHIISFLILKDCMEKGLKTIIHCAQGKSRSVSVVILFLMLVKNMTYDEAFSFLKAKRKVISDKNFKLTTLNTFLILKSLGDNHAL